MQLHYLNIKHSYGDEHFVIPNGNLEHWLDELWHTPECDDPRDYILGHAQLTLLPVERLNDGSFRSVHPYSSVVVHHTNMIEIEDDAWELEGVTFTL